MSLAKSFLQNSYCILPSLFSPSQCDHIAGLFDNHWAARGRPKLLNFGMAVHPLLEQIPDIGPYYAHPLLLETLAQILDDTPRLVHTGARVSNEDSTHLLGWHEHYSWDKSSIPLRKRPERVLFGCYVRGSNDDTGPLIVHPRPFNAPLLPCPVGMDQPWPGQLEVDAPAGSVVIFDTALFHTARRGSKPGTRYLFGAHVQGKKESRPHPEDNITPGFKSTHPQLQRFINPACP